MNANTIFCGGAAYVPDDVLLPRTTVARYRSLLCLMKSGNQNLVRVWRGGIYEKPTFMIFVMSWAFWLGKTAVLFVETTQPLTILLPMSDRRWNKMCGACGIMQV